MVNKSRIILYVNPATRDDLHEIYKAICDSDNKREGEDLGSLLAKRDLKALTGYHDGSRFEPAEGWSKESVARKGVNVIITALTGKPGPAGNVLRSGVDKSGLSDVAKKSMVEDIVRAAEDANLSLELPKARAR